MNYTDEDIRFLREKVIDIYKNTQDLQRRLKRSFTIDGHMAGSIGEIFASYYYGIELYGQSAKTHDGVFDGKHVQVKMSQGTGVEVKECPEHLIVLSINVSFEDVCVTEVYNGPGDKAISGLNKNRNDEYALSFKHLMEIQSEVLEDERIPQTKRIASWKSM